MYEKTVFEKKKNSFSQRCPIVRILTSCFLRHRNVCQQATHCCLSESHILQQLDSAGLKMGESAWPTNLTPEKLTLQYYRFTALYK
jgi:hypothetical protein